VQLKKGNTMQNTTATKTVFKALRANKGATANKLAELTDIPSNKVAKLLHTLAQRDAVQMIKVKGMRAMYVAKPNVKFNAPKSKTSRKPRVAAKSNAATVAQLQQTIAQAQALLKQLQK
jgi:Sugar-specific transcriptional regulator TrmB